MKRRNTKEIKEGTQKKIKGRKQKRNKKEMKRRTQQ